MILSVHRKQRGEGALQHIHMMCMRAGGRGALIIRSLCLRWVIWHDAGTVEGLLEHSISTSRFIFYFIFLESQHVLSLLFHSL